jgi:hypothetical protein
MASAGTRRAFNVRDTSAAMLVSTVASLLRRKEVSGGRGALGVSPPMR